MSLSQPESQEQGSGTVEPGTREHPVNAVWNFLFSAGWLILGWSLCQFAPVAALHADWLVWLVNMVPLVATLALIAWNFWASLSILGKTGRAVKALPLTLLQVFLFGLLFYQIACHRGAEHFVWERAPGWADWCLFLLMHAFRAADLVDLVEAYGWKLQVIHSASHATAWTLIAYHLVINLFLLALLIQLVERWRHAITADERRRVLLWRSSLVAIVMFTLAWITTAFFWRPWRTSDLILWPVDNLIRVFDFCDAMEIYRVRLHQVPQLFWEGTLTLLCRVMLVVSLAGVLSRIFEEVSIRLLDGRGLQPQELERMSQQHPQKQCRNRAGRRAAKMRRLEAIPVGWPYWWEVLLVLAPAYVLAIVVLIASSGDVSQRLVTQAISSDEQAAERATAALRRLGARQEDAVEQLAEAVPSLSAPRQVDMIESLGHFGSAAVPPVEKWLQDDRFEVRTAAMRALRRIGPSSSSALVNSLSSDHDEVRRSARNTLVVFGSDAIDPLIQHVTGENAIDTLDLLEKLDPYWYLEPSIAPASTQLKLARLALIQLETATTAEQLGDAIQKILAVPALGPPLGVHAMSDCLQSVDTDRRNASAEALLLRTAKGDRKFRSLLLVILSGAGSDSIDIVTDALTIDVPQVQCHAARALARMGPFASLSVEPLVKLMSASAAEVREAATDALVAIGPDSVPHLSVLLRTEQGSVRREALSALGRFGADAAPVAPELVELFERFDDAEKKTVVAMLGQMGPQVVPQLVRMIRQDDVRGEVVAALVNIGGPAVPELANMLAPQQSFSDVEKLSALEVLRLIGPDAEAAVPSLLQTLANPSMDVLLASIETLSSIGSDEQLVLPKLISMLDDDRFWYLAAKKVDQTVDLNGDDQERAAALRSEHPIITAMEKMDPGWAESPQFQTILHQSLDELLNGVGLSRQNASTLLARLGPAAKSLVPQLVDAMNDSGVEQTRTLVKLLGDIGPDAASAVPELIGKLDQGIPRGVMDPPSHQIGPDARPDVVVVDVPEQVDEFEPDDSFYDMSRDTNVLPLPEHDFNDQVDSFAIDITQPVDEFDPDKTGRNIPHDTIIHALGQIGPDARAAVPVLIQYVGTPYHDFAIDALEKIDPQWWSHESIETVVPNLVRLLGTRNQARSTAALLGKLGPTAKVAVTDLVKALVINDVQIKQAVTDALSQIDPAWPQSDSARAALPALFNVLSQSVEHSPAGAIPVLEQVDPNWENDERLQPALKQMALLLSDTSEQRRSKALELLNRIDSEWPQRDAVRQSIPIIISRLAYPGADSRSAAAAALQMIDPDWRNGEQARKGADLLIKVIEQGPNDEFAAMGLAIIGPPAAAKAVSVLARLLPNRDIEYQQAATEALDKLNPKWRNNTTIRRNIMKRFNESSGTEKSWAANAREILNNQPN